MNASSKKMINSSWAPTPKSQYLRGFIHLVELAFFSKLSSRRKEVLLTKNVNVSSSSLFRIYVFFNL